MTTTEQFSAGGRRWVWRRADLTLFAASADLAQSVQRSDATSMPVFATEEAAAERAGVVGGGVVLVAHPRPVHVPGLAAAVGVTTLMAAGLATGYGLAAAVHHLRETL